MNFLSKIQCLQENMGRVRVRLLCTHIRVQKTGNKHSCSGIIPQVIQEKPFPPLVKGQAAALKPDLLPVVSGSIQDIQEKNGKDKFWGQNKSQDIGDCSCQRAGVGRDQRCFAMNKSMKIIGFVGFHSWDHSNNNNNNNNINALIIIIIKQIYN